MDFKLPCGTSESQEKPSKIVSLTVCRSLLLRGGGAGSDPPQFPPWVWAWRGGSVMALCCGLLLCPSVMAFWFGGLQIEGGLLVESGLPLWPSGKVFWCGGLLIEGGLLVESGLLLWPSGKAFWCGGLLVWDHFQPEGLQTRRPPNQKATLNQKSTKPEGPPQSPSPPTRHPQTRHPPGDLL